MPKKRSDEDARQYLIRNGLSLLSPDVEYSSAHTHTDFICRKCGNKYVTTFNTVIRQHGTMCPKCRAEETSLRMRFTKEQVQQRLKEVGAPLLSPNATYENQNKTTMFICPQCGEEYADKYVQVIRHNVRWLCHKCRANLPSPKRFTFEEAQSKLKEVGASLMKEGQNFLGWNNKYTFICKTCKREFIRTYTDAVDRIAICNRCSRHTSLGEKYVAKWLEEWNISFKTQYKFSDCKDVRPLPFDFLVKTPDNLEILVEIDGLQHEKQLLNWNFESTVKHDRIKEEYCKKHKITLVRIKYDSLSSKCYKQDLLRRLWYGLSIAYVNHGDDRFPYIYRI